MKVTQIKTEIIPFGPELICIKSELYHEDDILSTGCLFIRLEECVNADMTIFIDKTTKIAFSILKNFESQLSAREKLKALGLALNASQPEPFVPATTPKEETTVEPPKKEEAPAAEKPFVRPPVKTKDMKWALTPSARYDGKCIFCKEGITKGEPQRMKPESEDINNKKWIVAHPECWQAAVGK